MYFDDDYDQYQWIKVGLAEKELNQFPSYVRNLISEKLEMDSLVTSSKVRSISVIRSLFLRGTRLRVFLEKLTLVEEIRTKRYIV